MDKLPANGSLVRFRGMVQDTGLGGELFPATNADGSKLFMYGREDDAADVAVCSYATDSSHNTVAGTDALYVHRPRTTRNCANGSSSMSLVCREKLPGRRG